MRNKFVNFLGLIVFFIVPIAFLGCSVSLTPIPDEKPKTTYTVILYPHTEHEKVYTNVTSVSVTSQAPGTWFKDKTGKWIYVQVPFMYFKE